MYYMDTYPFGLSVEFLVGGRIQLAYQPPHALIVVRLAGAVEEVLDLLSDCHLDVRGRHISPPPPATDRPTIKEHKSIHSPMSNRRR